jgi:hypothetical protein
MKKEVIEKIIKSQSITSLLYKIPNSLKFYENTLYFIVKNKLIKDK